MKSKKDFWFLLSGLATGMVIGLIWAWIFAPANVYNTTPSHLRIDFKDQYRYMIALSFYANQDLLRAKARLGTLGDQDDYRALGEEAQRMLGNNASLSDVQILADLSQALKDSPTLVEIPTIGSQKDFTTAPNFTASPSNAPTSVIIETSTREPEYTTPPTIIYSPTIPLNFPSSTPTLIPSITSAINPTPSLTVVPAQTNTSTPVPNYNLINTEYFCDSEKPGVLEVNVLDSSKQGIPGVELIMTWAEGEEHFFTGLKPELGNGFADYKMTQDIDYALTIFSGEIHISSLKVSNNCSDKNGITYPGGIHLDFQHN